MKNNAPPFMCTSTSRRQFLKQSLTVTGAAMGACMLGPIPAVAAQAAPPDLVAVKNGDPLALFDKGISAMGGMRKYVQPNQTVVIKPNIGWERGPETGANTNPLLVKRIVEHCIEAGAKKVYIFDHAVDITERCYKASGIEEAATAAGAIFVPGDDHKYYQEVEVPGGRYLKKTKVHELVLESDVYINVPVLKNHFASSLTMAMKNQMGIVYNRMAFHGSSLHGCIADLCRFKTPDLNILDAYLVTLRGGPQKARLEDLSKMKTLMISEDIVAIDSAGAALFGRDAENVGHIFKGNEAKIGEMDLSKLTIQKFDLAA